MRISAGSRAVAASCQSRVSGAARSSPGAKANWRVSDGVLPGHLVAAGGGEDVLAHRDQHRGDVLAGRVEVAEQRLGEEAVPPDAVVGDVVGLGGEGEEEAGGVADAGEPVAVRAAERRGRRRQRVVAAGVEEDEVDAGGAFELAR